MKKILVFLFITISFGCIGQKLVQLEPCKDQYGNPKDSCFIMSGLPTGHGRWIDIDLLRQIIGSPDSIPSGVICSSLGGIPTGTVATGDHFIVKSATGCKRVPFNLIVSPLALCAAAQATVNGVYDTDDKVLYLRPDGSCYKDTIHWSAYGGLDCPGVIDCISGNPLFCEEVENCLTSGTLCNSIGGISTGNYALGDRLLFQRADGTCYRDSIRWEQYGGIDCPEVLDCITGDPDFCTEVQNCINSSYICQTLNGFGGMNFIPQYLIGINNGQCAKVDGNLFGSAAICSNLNLLGYSGAVDTVFGTYNGQCYKVALPSGGSNFNCDTIKDCLSEQWFCDTIKACLDDFLCDSIKACLNTFLCDSIVACVDGFLCDSIISCIQNDTTICDLFLECLDNPRFDTLVCEALHSFPFQEASSTGDTVIAINGGTCYKTVLNTGSGEVNCDTIRNCVNEFLCDSILACVGNVYCDILKGLDNLPFEGNGSHKLFFTDGGACYSSSLEAQGANCISAGLANGVITVGLNIDPIGGITCGANGIKVDLCPFFAGLPNGNPYTGQPLVGADCKTYTVNTNITCPQLGALFSSGGQLGATDQIMTSGCIYKTLGNPLSCSNIDAAFPLVGALAPGDQVLVWADGGCARKTLPCYQVCGCYLPCNTPDINPVLPKIQSRLEELEKENKELRKIITEIQKKLK